MKKLILTFLFIFAINISSNVSAENKQLLPPDCFQEAIDALDEMEEALGFTINDYDGATVMNNTYAACYCLANLDSESCWEGL